MPSAPSAERLASWKATLDQLQAAEDRGDRSEAIRLRQFLIRDRLNLRTQTGADAVATLDLVLLDRFCRDLRRSAFHEEAFLVAQSALGWTLRQGDAYGSAHFRIQAAHAAIALLDFHGARTVLRELLPALRNPSPHDEGPALAAVEHWSAPDADPQDLRELRAELLEVLAELWAATGRLDAADRALTRVLAEDSRTPLREVAGAEAALRLAEIRLDRGDRHGFEKVRRHPRSAEDVRWKVLDGIARLQEARYSEALSCLESALADAAPPRSTPWSHLAQWLRIHVLCALNQMDTAEELLDRLAASQGIDPTDLSVARALIHARRTAGPIDFGLPPTAREVLDPAPSDVDKTASITAAGPIRDSRPLQRTRARVRDEWAMISNRVQLHLHAGRIDEALPLFLPLVSWTPHLDSPLLAARLEYLWAVVALQAGDPGSAEQHASEAARRFQHLGMPQDEWAARRVQGWALERQHAPQERIDEAQSRAQHLLSEIRRHLHPSDFITLSLNKWSVREEEFSRQFHALRAQLAAPRKTPTWFHALRRPDQRLLEDFVVRLATVQHWEVTAPKEPAEPDSPDLPLRRSDIFSWTRRQLRLRSDSNDDDAPAFTRLPRTWMPRDTAVLQYLVLPDRIELLVATAAGIRLLTPATRTTRVELWQFVRRALRRLQYDPTWKPESLAELGRRLGIDEVAAQLTGNVRHWLVIPDNVLVNVPFPVLPLEGRHPLVERFSCAYLPRLKWVSSVPHRARRYRAVAAFAVPASAAAPDWPALPFVTTEIEALASLGAGDFQRFVGPQAATPQLVSVWPNLDVVHFACHGEFHPDAPHSSGLLLNDGWLTLDRVERLPPCRLEFAMLGSCWGANASLLPGGEAVGLPTAFLHRGARGVVTSLWQVPDQASVDFTRTFYQQTAKVGAVEGMAAAQRDAWSRRLPPRIWAGYVFYVRGMPARWPFGPWLRLRAWLHARRRRWPFNRPP